jgi:hypothetical protein
VSGSESEQYEKQRRHALHNANLQGEGQRQHGETGEILRELSKIDDLPIDPKDDAVMGQLISKLTSTSNLSVEDVRSNEWVREYILILWLCKKPKEGGSHGAWRGWAHGDRDAELEPISTEKRLEVETLVTSSKLALARSEEAKVIEESTRNVNESIVNDGEGDSGGGGILGRLQS